MNLETTGDYQNYTSSSYLVKYNITILSQTFKRIVHTGEHPSKRGHNFMLTDIVKYTCVLYSVPDSTRILLRVLIIFCLSFLFYSVQQFCSFIKVKCDNKGPRPTCSNFSSKRLLITFKLKDIYFLFQLEKCMFLDALRFFRVCVCVCNVELQLILSTILN